MLNISNMTYDRDMSESEEDALQQTLTINQVFDLTPKNNESFGSCRVKIPQTYKLAEGTDSLACLKMFRVYKFFFVEYVCYRYEYTLKPDLFLFEELANTPKLSGVIYEITPGDMFNNYQNSKFVIHTGNVFPAKSVGLSPVMYRGDGWQNESVNSATYFVIYFKLQKTRLPPPRTTNCRDYNATMKHQSRAACRQACIKEKSTKILKRVPFSSIQTTRTNLKAVSYLDIVNDEIRRKTFRFLNECNEHCFRKDCAERTTFNRISHQTSEKLRLQVMIPEEPWINVIYKELMTSTEYVTYVLSCFGTWFGLSAITLNPFTIGRKFIKSWNDRKFQKSSKNFIARPDSDDAGRNSSRRLNTDKGRASRSKDYVAETIRKLDIVFEKQRLMDDKYDKIIDAISKRSFKDVYKMASGHDNEGYTFNPWTPTMATSPSTRTPIRRRTSIMRLPIRVIDKKKSYLVDLTR